MTWQGSGGTGSTGGTGGESGQPDDATRTDWNAADGSPGGAPLPPPAEPGRPWQPGDAPPPAPVAPPAAPSYTPSEPTPWSAPVQPADAWAAPANDGGRFAVPGAPGLVYAGAVPRAAAWIVDSFLLGIVVAIISAPFAASTPGLPANPAVPFDPNTFAARTGVASVVGLVIEAAYFILLWLSGGRATLGMRLFNLQVGDAATGAKLEPAQAAKRWLAYGTFLSVFALSAVLAPIVALVQALWTLALLVTTVSSPTKQGLHDRLAGSAVVRPASAGNGLALTCLFVAFVVPLLIAVAALLFLGTQLPSIMSAVGQSV